MRTSGPLHLALTVLLAPCSLGAQSGPHDGTWLLSPPILQGFCINVDSMQVATQLPSITVTLGYQGIFNTSWPMTGTFTTPNQATLQGGIASQCGYTSTLTIAFVNPAQCQCTFQLNAFPGCFCVSFTAQLTGQRSLSGSCRTFGSGCPGTAGVPILVPATLPSVTNGMAVTLWGLPANAAFLITGASNTGAYLAPYGMPGCWLYASPDSTRLVSGPAPLLVNCPIPTNPNLVGATFYQQALVLSPGTNALGAVMSEGKVCVVGT